MRTEHRIILEALDLATEMAGEPVLADVVHAALDPEEIQQLEATYSPAAGDTVKRVLSFYAGRGEISSELGEDSKYRYANDPPRGPHEEPVSNRQKVLDAVEGCVDQVGRPVLVSDVQEWIDGLEVELSRYAINVALASLVRTGELEVVEKVRGQGRGGNNLYAPVGRFDSEQRDYALPRSWFQGVMAAFHDCWERCVEKAREVGRKPRPPATGDVRERVRERGEYLERLENPQLLCNALRALADGDHPRLRAVRRPGERLLLWAPLDVSDEALDLGDSYATDTERVCEAVRRAEAIAGHPVTVREVKSQVEADPALAPAGSSSVAQILSCCAKTRLGGLERANQRVHRVGSVGGRSLYTSASEAQGRTYVELRAVEAELADAEVSERRAQIAECPLETVKYGRARLLTAELRALESRINELDIDPDGTGPVEQLRNHLYQTVETELDLVHLELPALPHGLPETPEDPRDGFVADELMVLLQGIYPAAEDLDRPIKLVPLLEKFVRRIPNPNHTGRFDSDPRVAAEYLFERTDMLQKAAFRWGSDEARIQATISRNVLGRLRDLRFVVPALASDDSDVRGSAVACLAFLQDPGALEALEEVGREDPDPQVRAAAGWASALLEARDELSNLQAVLVG